MGPPYMGAGAWSRTGFQKNGAHLTDADREDDRMGGRIDIETSATAIWRHPFCCVEPMQGVAIPRERVQTAAISGPQCDGNSGTHAPDSHASSQRGIPSRIQMSDAIH